ncbi:MAG: LysR family transcriptional regulator [Lachnospiraceae bacterium]|nr:LysR family transcriptional regulator [Lachnospiraceae bacterium]
METESTLSSYHIFNAVAEAGNISKAAKTLFISQPAISRAVSKLEQNLSVKLFVRGSRGVHLTEEGRLLYEHTKSAFDSLRQGEENLRRLGTQGIGQLRIGVSTTLCKYILMPYLQKFIQEYPHIQVTIQCHSTFETLELLEDGIIDIGLISEPDSLRTLEFLPVTEIEDIFVTTETYLKNLKLREQSESPQPDAPARKNRRSATKKASDSALSFFKSGTLMLLDEKNISRLYIEDYFNKNHIETGQILDVSNMDLLIDFSKIGLGIGCVIKEFVQKELEDHTLIELPLPSKTVRRKVGFVYSKTTLQSGSVHKFIEFYKGGTR